MMFNPWVSSYLGLTLLGLDMAERFVGYWQDTINGTDYPVRYRNEPWLSHVEPFRSGWARRAMVYNCAAAAYAHGATDLSRLRPANDTARGERPNRRAR